MANCCFTLFTYVIWRKHSSNAFSEQTLIKTAVLCNVYMTEHTICLLAIISRSNILSACSSYDCALFTLLVLSTIKISH